MSRKTQPFIFFWVIFISSVAIMDTIFAQGQVSFRDARRDFAVGRAPVFIATGDFNGDDIPDLAVANLESSTVSVLLGNGDGTFELVGNYQLVFATDFHVWVLLGNGDGTFQPGLGFEVGPSPRDFSIGDFNGDGIPDLALTRSFSNEVLILLGRGDGTFELGPTIQVAGYASLITTGDFDGDGIDDLALEHGEGNLVYWRPCWEMVMERLHTLADLGLKSPFRLLRWGTSMEMASKIW